MKKTFLKTFSKKLLTGSMVISIAFYAAFHFSTQSSNAQQASTNKITAVCTPQKKEVTKNEEVIFTVRVENATSSLSYSWSGLNIQTQNSPRITVRYDAKGKKNATSTVTTNGVIINAPCEVEVKAAEDIDPAQIQKALESLSQLFQNNQSGGAPGGTNSNGGGGAQNGQTNGGSNGGGGNSIKNPETQEKKEEQARQKAAEELKSEEKKKGTEIDQEQKECKGENKAKTMKNSIEETTPKATEQQMVPTNPIPIVDPILEIRDNIALLTEKEIGTKDQTGPALDQVVNCETNIALVKSLEAAVNFIYKFDPNGTGGPTFITNYTNYFIDVRDKATEAFLYELQNNDKSCNPEEDKNIAEALAKRVLSTLEETSQKQCSDKTGEKDKNDLSDMKNYVNYAAGLNNFAIRNLQEEEDLDKSISSKLKTEAYETDIALGFKNRLDDEKNIKDPAVLYVSRALKSFGIAVDRVVTFDEVNETKKEFEKLLVKMSLDQDISQFAI